MGSNTSAHSSSSRSSHTRHGRHHKIPEKILTFLHSFNLIFSLVSIAIFTAIIPLWNANFFHSTGLLRGDWPDGLVILPLSVTLLSSSNYLVRLFYAKRASPKPGDYLKSRRTTHETPKAARINLYLTLTVLLLLLAFLILAGVSGLYRFWRPAIITSSVQLSSGTPSSSITLSTLSLRHIARSISGSTPTNPSVTPPNNTPSAQNSKATFHSCTLANVFTRRCNPTLYLLGDLQIAAISSASLVWFLNLIILVLQARDHQYQKRRYQRSLRAKARSKLDLIEDEMSRAEKGHHSTRKKIHHDSRQRGHSKSPSTPPPMSDVGPRVTRPARAHTTTNPISQVDHADPRPKHHYYDPNITPSRSRSTREPTNGSDTTINSATSLSGKNASASASLQQQQQASRDVMPQKWEPTAYSRAVDEARRKVKPAETMRDWLAGRS